MAFDGDDSIDIGRSLNHSGHVIDAQDRKLLPGLIEAHSHLGAQNHVGWLRQAAVFDSHR